MASHFSLSKAFKQALELEKPDGTLNFDASRKVKQIEHFHQILIPKIKAQLEKHLLDYPGAPIEVIELGSGKSYLGFALYDLYLKNLPHHKLFCVDARLDVCEKSKTISQKLKHKDVEIIHREIDQLDNTVFDRINSISNPFRVVIALHACDTATDDAIEFGKRIGAQILALAPCCQAQVARESAPSTAIFKSLFKHALHRRELSALLTNKLRSLYLEQLGFQVTVTEFTDKEHTAKSELILAHTTKTRQQAISPPQEFSDLLHSLGLVHDPSHHYIQKNTLIAT